MRTRRPPPKRSRPYPAACWSRQPTPSGRNCPAGTACVAVGHQGPLGALVVADTARTTFPFPWVGAQRDRVRYLLQKGYHVVLSRDGWIVLKPPGTTPDLRATR